MRVIREVRGHYRRTDPAMFAKGSKYGPLQSDGFDYLCPDCGGYGYLPNDPECGFCSGVGTIPLDDKRVKARGQDEEANMSDEKHHG
jgi:RecJ-like exonuclease